jgi:DNA helicase-2/ATP-dependent DNA helicase PcrA
MPGTTSQGQFFDLASQVLEQEDRGPLPPAESSPHRSIIAVMDTDRVLQILAGPGSGKTEMLVWRILYDLCVCGTKSEEILVTTFTRRAATDLNVRIVERSDELLHVAQKAGVLLDDPKVHNLRVGTIHSLCDTLLAEFDDDYMEAGTQLIDEPECVARLARHYRFALGYNTPGAGAVRLVNRLLACQPLVALFRAPWERKPGWPTSLMERVSFLQALLYQQIETWHPRCGAAGKPNGIQVLHGPATLTADLMLLQERWEEYLNNNHILDFATIQKRFLDVQPSLLKELRLRHVFVDEFQDNNPIQFALHVGWLAEPSTRLTVVGDDDQALYRFRGSDIACFNQLKPFCTTRAIPYRLAKLEENHRSTKTIVAFSQAFRAGSILNKVSMPKKIVHGPKAVAGDPVRLLRGPWTSICRCVAAELGKDGCGRIPPPGAHPSPTAAVLMFSTSEGFTDSPAQALKSALAAKNVRAYNPRNKTAANAGSPVHELVGLLSYLIDPITTGAVTRGVPPLVAASRSKYAAQARSEPADFPVTENHLAFQKTVRGIYRTIPAAPPPEYQQLLTYIDDIRDRLVTGTAAHLADPKKHPLRLTLSGLVARLLSLDRYRNSGFTERLFRQALFTTLLEAQIAPTRLSRESLDSPLEVSRNAASKYVWPGRLWSFLSVFASYLDNATIDDVEVEAFEEHAVLLLTFHQAKGLQFDHVYVAATGREPDVSPALRTLLFSGESPAYRIDAGSGALVCTHKPVLELALADREREVYVAVTRPKRRLTILHDPDHQLPFLALNPNLEALFPGRPAKAHPASKDVQVLEYKP